MNTKIASLCFSGLFFDGLFDGQKCFSLVDSLESRLWMFGGKVDNGHPRNRDLARRRSTAIDDDGLKSRLESTSADNADRKWERENSNKKILSFFNKFFFF